MPLIDEQFIKDMKQSLADQKDNTHFLCENSEQAKQAHNKILRLVNVRERSVSEMWTRLIDEGFEEEVVEEALKRACNCGIIDDLRFAACLIRSRLAAGKGVFGIGKELERHGIATEELDEATSELLPSAESELARALAILQQKPPQAKNKREGAYRRLVSKGYAPSTAGEAARLWHDEYLN